MATETTHHVTSRPWSAVRTLCWRELVRFFRQKNRVVGAIGQPVIFWLLFGSGLGSSFRMPGGGEGGPDYREYFFPGTLTLILLFTAIFATISIIEDRREGFLQSVLVAPIPRWAMILGKILGGTSIAMLQGLVFLTLALTLNIELSVATIAAVVGYMMLVSLALTSLGFTIAWRMESTQGFHAIMSVFLLPMWLLSGAFFPAPPIAAGAGLIDRGVYWIMQVNPMTYCVSGLRELMYTATPTAALPADLPSFTTSLTITILFALATFTSSWLISARRTTGDLL